MIERSTNDEGSNEMTKPATADLPDDVTPEDEARAQAVHDRIEQGMTDLRNGVTPASQRPKPTVRQERAAAKAARARDDVTPIPKGSTRGVEKRREHPINPTSKGATDMSTKAAINTAAKKAATTKRAAAVKKTAAKKSAPTRVARPKPEYDVPKGSVELKLPGAALRHYSTHKDTKGFIAKSIVDASPNGSSNVIVVTKAQAATLKKVGAAEAKRVEDAGRGNRTMEERIVARALATFIERI